jgi:hypothetical protein
VGRGKEGGKGRMKIGRGRGVGWLNSGRVTMRSEEGDKDGKRKKNRNIHPLTATLFALAASQTGSNRAKLSSIVHAMFFWREGGGGGNKHVNSTCR